MLKNLFAATVAFLLTVTSVSTNVYAEGPVVKAELSGHVETWTLLMGESQKGDKMDGETTEEEYPKVPERDSDGEFDVKYGFSVKNGDHSVKAVIKHARDAGDIKPDEHMVVSGEGKKGDWKYEFKAETELKNIGPDVENSRRDIWVDLSGTNGLHFKLGISNWWAPDAKGGSYLWSQASEWRDGDDYGLDKNYGRMGGLGIGYKTGDLSVDFLASFEGDTGGYFGGVSTSDPSADGHLTDTIGLQVGFKAGDIDGTVHIGTSAIKGNEDRGGDGDFSGSATNIGLYTEYDAETLVPFVNIRMISISQKNSDNDYTIDIIHFDLGVDVDLGSDLGISAAYGSYSDSLNLGEGDTGKQDVSFLALGVSKEIGPVKVVGGYQMVLGSKATLTDIIAETANNYQNTKLGVGLVYDF